MLAWRWSFDEVSMPNKASFIDSIDRQREGESDALARFFRGYKLILRTNNTFDLVLLKKYLHGTWSYNDETRVLTLSDGSNYIAPLTARVDSINPALLNLTFENAQLAKVIPPFADNLPGYAFFKKEGRFSFSLIADEERYRSETKDPYSRLNNMWRIKPAKPETAAQIFNRIDNHLQFWKLLVQDAIDNDKGYISFHWFESPLIVASNGAALRTYEGEKEEWDENFYDSLQAKEGYALLKKCFAKKINLGNSDSHFQNDIVLLNQLIDNLHK